MFGRSHMLHALVPGQMCLDCDISESFVYPKNVPTFFILVLWNYLGYQSYMQINKKILAHPLLWYGFLYQPDL